MAGDGTPLGHFRKDIPMVDPKGRPQRHFAYAFDEVAAQAQAAATVVTGEAKLPFGPSRSADSVTRVMLLGSAAGSGSSVGPAGPMGPPARRSEDTTRVVLIGSSGSSSAASGNWVPLSAGTEPLTWISDGAGNPIFTWFAP